MFISKSVVWGVVLVFLFAVSAVGEAKSETSHKVAVQKKTKKKPKKQKKGKKASQKLSERIKALRAESRAKKRVATESDKTMPSRRSVKDKAINEGPVPNEHGSGDSHPKGAEPEGAGSQHQPGNTVPDNKVSADEAGPNEKDDEADEHASDSERD